MRTNRATWLFFGLVLLLSLPFYALGLTAVALPFAPALPISALGAVVPMAAALVLIHRQGGTMAAKAFLARTLDFRIITAPIWGIMAALFMPVAFMLTGSLVWLSGAALPPLHPVSAGTVIPVFILFFIGAVGEELGWQGHAFSNLRDQCSALQAALIIGVFWALWHVIPFALMGRSMEWIIWHGLAMVLMRIVIVWLALNAGPSIAVAVLFHVMSNSVWGMFAGFADYYNPMVMCAVLLVAVSIILWIWGPTMVRRPRNA